MIANSKSRLTMIILAFAAFFLAAALPCAVRAEEPAREPRNGIPLVIIRIQETKPTPEDTGEYHTIAEMNSDPYHNIRCQGTIQIKVPQGFESEFGGTVPAGEVSLSYIRGRGNSTWGQPKKPYKIKLDSKEDLFGMGANKEWGLLANHMDATLIKNRFTYLLGRQMEMEGTPQLVPCDLVMIGSNAPDTPISLGSYYLSELIGVGASRLDIGKPDDNIPEEGELNITGGYLLSLFTTGQNSDEPPSTVFRTDAGIAMMNKEPEYAEEPEEGSIKAQQRSYIRDYIQEVEDLIVNSPQITPQIHEQIAGMLDLQSVADYWLFQEFSKNGDGFETSSTYFYKKRDGKLYFGPLWDFDQPYGEYPIEDITDDEGVTGFNNTQMLWVDHLRQKDPIFVTLLRARWHEMDTKLTALTAENGAIDRYSRELALSKAADDEIWEHASDDEWDDEGAQDEGGQQFEPETYEETIGNLKDWIRARQYWINHNLREIDNVFATLTYTAEGQEIAVRMVRREQSLDARDIPDPPVKPGYVFDGWFPQGTDKRVEYMVIEEDMIVEARYIPESEAIAPTALYFNDYNVWQPLGYEFFSLPTPTIIPEDATDQRITWTSSNPEVAEIGVETIIPKGVEGSTVITGTLHNGVTRSMVLHIYDPAREKVDPTSLTLENSHYDLKVGESTQIRYTVLPDAPNTGEDTLFEADDPTIAEVSPASGVITGLKPGTTTITATLRYDYDQQTGYKGALTATCTVTVTEDPKICTITYDLNGGTLDGKTGNITEQHKQGDVIKVMKAPTREGYEFAYWEGSVLYPGQDYTVQEDHTLKAIWTKVPGGGEADSGSGSKPGAKKNNASAVSPKAVRTISKAGTAKTGDRYHAVIWTACLLISTAAILMIVRRKRRRV